MFYFHLGKFYKEMLLWCAIWLPSDTVYIGKARSMFDFFSLFVFRWWNYSYLTSYKVATFKISLWYFKNLNMLYGFKSIVFFIVEALSGVPCLCSLSSYTVIVLLSFMFLQSATHYLCLHCDGSWFRNGSVSGKYLGLPHYFLKLGS